MPIDLVGWTSLLFSEAENWSAWQVRRRRKTANWTANHEPKKGDRHTTEWDSSGFQANAVTLEKKIGARQVLSKPMYCRAEETMQLIPSYYARSPEVQLKLHRTSDVF